MDNFFKLNLYPFLDITYIRKETRIYVYPILGVLYQTFLDGVTFSH